MSSPIEVHGSQQSTSETPRTTPPAAPFEPAETETEPVGPSQAGNDDNMEVDVEAVDDEEDEEGTISLPLSKIKRICKMDPEFMGASQSAVFAAGVATELFIQYFTEQAAVLAKLEKRKKVVYKDFSNAVDAQDSLHFLSDTVPKTVPLKKVLKDIEEAQNPQPEVELVPDIEEGDPVAQKRRIDIMSMLPVQPSDQPPQPIRKANISDLL